MNVNELIRQGKVQVVDDEVFDNFDDVMFMTGIVLPDGRELATFRHRIFAKYPGGSFELYEPAGLSPWDRIEALRKIVAEHQAAMIDGALVDAFSASAMVQVFDAVSMKNKIRLLTLPIEKMVDVCFRVLG